jgi:hypothetical protein
VFRSTSLSLFSLPFFHSFGRYLYIYIRMFFCFHLKTTKRKKMLPHFSPVPHTSMLSINFQEVARDEHEMMGLESLEKVQFPVCRMVGGTKGGFFELPKLMEWVRRNQTDPITRQPMNWNDYEAVQWEEGSLPEESNKLYNYRTTDLTLRLLQLGEFDLERDSEFHFFDRQRYREIREAFRQATLNPMQPRDFWLNTYWIVHQYDPLTEFPPQGIIYPPFMPFVATNPDRFRDFMESLRTLFRRDMATRVPRSAFVDLYWEAHPLDPQRDPPMVQRHYAEMMRRRGH